MFVDSNLEMNDNEDCEDLDSNKYVINRDCDIDSDLEMFMNWKLVLIE